jgi:outer membrane protein TolC
VATRVHSLAARIRESRRTLELAEQTPRLARDRREFAVGATLETIDPEQNLVRAARLR